MSPAESKEPTHSKSTGGLHGNMSDRIEELEKAVEELKAKVS